MTAEILLKQMLDAIESNKTADGHAIYPDLIFGSLPMGWLRDVRELYAESHNATPARQKNATDAENSHETDS